MTLVNTEGSACIYRQAGQFVLRSLGGESLLVPVRSSVIDLDSVYILNPVGAVVWEMVDKASDLSAFVSAIVSRFDVTVERAEKDVRDFLADLEDAKLIQRVG